MTPWDLRHGGRGGRVTGRGRRCGRAASAAAAAGTESLGTALRGVLRRQPRVASSKTLTVWLRYEVISSVFVTRNDRFLNNR